MGRGSGKAERGGGGVAWDLGSDISKPKTNGFLKL